MIDDAGASAPIPFADAIAAAADAGIPSDLYKLPKTDRMKRHRKALRAIFIQEGLQGVAAYKKLHPEAATIRMKFDAKAYTPKPAGYDAYLVDLAEKWLTDEAALGRTNRADIEKLNRALGTDYSPDKHFSEPLADGRLKKIKDVFLLHGAYLDTDRDNTMSRVRKAAKAHRSKEDGGKPLGTVGLIRNGEVVIGNRSFPLVMNLGKQCIRVTIDGQRRRFYLSDLQWMADLIGGPGPDPLSDTSNPVDTTTTCSIGELAYPPEQPENQQFGGGQISGSAYRLPALADRIAKSKATQPAHSTSSSDGRDPLEL